ncbi:MAG: diguanylate cyclase [Microcoleaceae cyanobacterium]
MSHISGRSIKNVNSEHNQNQLLQQVEQHFKHHSRRLTQEVLHHQEVESDLDYQQQLLRTVIDTSPNIIFVKNWDGEYILANQAVAKFYGTTVDQLIGKTDADFNPNPQQVEFLRNVDRQVMITQEQKNILAEPVQRWDGETRWFKTTKIPILSPDETSYYVLGVATDMTERHEAEKILWLQAEQERLLNTITHQIYQRLTLVEILEEIVTQLHEILMVDRVVLYRPIGADCYQAIAEQKLPQWPSLQNQVIDEGWFTQTLGEFAQEESVEVCAISDLETLPDSTQIRLSDQQVKSLLVLPILHAKKLSQYCCTTNYSCIDNSNNYQIWGFVAVHQCSDTRQWLPEEISLLKSLAAVITIAIQQGQLRAELEAANQKLQQLANHDGLTGLANRYRFDEYLQQEWKRMARESQPLSLILIDVDFFKNYNDTYGHPAGDQCLKEIAEVIRESIQRAGDLAARYGGEEFAIILSNTPLAGARRVAERVQQSLRKIQLEHKGSTVSEFVTISCGVSSFIPDYYQSPTSLIQASDQALYQAKASGRNRIIQASPVQSLPHRSSTTQESDNRNRRDDHPPYSCACR